MFNNEHELYRKMQSVKWNLDQINENIMLLRDYLEEIKLTVSFEEFHGLGQKYSKCLHHFNEALEISQKAVEELEPEKE